MALVLKDRVKETTTTTGTGTYTLAGAVTGFEAFSEVGDGNTTYYACTDGTDFEVGIGTYTASGTTLARTTILQSSNADAAVSWSAGSKTIFITQPAEKAVFIDGSGDVEFASGQTAKFNSNTTDPVIDIAGSGPNFIRFRQTTNFTDIANGVDIKYRTTPDDLLIERSTNNNIIAEFGGDDGHAALYFDNSKKLETLTGGVDVTGNITVSGTVDGRDVATDGTKLDGIESGATADQTKADIDALGIDAATLDSLDSTSFLRNRGDGQLNGTTQNFQQDFSSNSYFTTGEYIEIASISPGGSSRNYNISGKIMAQASQNAQVLDINVGIRFNSSGNFGYSILYNSSQMDTDWVEPVLWVNTTTDNIKLVIQAKAGNIHNLGVDLTLIQRGGYNDTTWNTTEVQTDTTTVPTGYTEYIGEKAVGSAANGAVELYYDNSKKLETKSDGVDITGELQSDSLDVDGNADISGTLTMGDYVVIPNNSQYAAKDTGSNVKRILHLGGDDNLYINQNDLANNVRITTNNTQRLQVTSGGDVQVLTGHLELGDDQELRIGDGTDLKIWHQSSSGNSFIQETGGGHLKITGDEIHLLNAANSEYKAKFKDDGAVELYYDNNLRLITTTDGVRVTGGPGDANLIIEADTDNVTEEDNATLTLKQDGGNITGIFGLTAGNHTYIQVHDGYNFRVTDSAGEYYLQAVADGAVELYYDNAKKFETTSSGINVVNTENDGPIIDLISDDPADAADYSVEGKIRFTAENSASESIEYASMRLRTADVTDGTEDGSIYFAFTQQGTNADKFAMLSGAFFLLDDNGYIEWNQTKGTSFDVILDTATPTADRRVTLPDATGTVVVQDSSGHINLGDNEEIKLGASGDLRILHDGGNSYIIDDGDGDLFLRASNNHYLQFANSEYALLTTENGGVELRYNNTKRLETTSTGVTIPGDLYITDNAVGFGQLELAGASGAYIDLKSPSSDDFDLRFITDGTTSNIRADDLHLQSASNEMYLDATANGAVNLYYDNSKKFETTSAGVTVTGDATISGDLYVNGGTIRSEDGTLDFGDNSGDLWGQISFLNSEPSGFNSQFNNATRITNLSGSAEQDLYLLDSTASSSGDIFGLASQGSPIFSVTGNAEIKLLHPNGNTSYDYTIAPSTPTANRTITLPNATGTVLTTGNSDTPTTTTAAADADFVLVDDGGTMKKITPANLGITAGAASVDDATALAIALG